MERSRVTQGVKTSQINFFDIGLTAGMSKLHMSLGSLAAWAEPKGFAAQDLFIAPKACAPAGTANS